MNLAFFAYRHPLQHPPARRHWSKIAAAPLAPSYRRAVVLISPTKDGKVLPPPSCPRTAVPCHLWPVNYNNYITVQSSLIHIISSRSQIQLSKTGCSLVYHPAHLHTLVRRSFTHRPPCTTNLLTPWATTLSTIQGPPMFISTWGWHPRAANIRIAMLLSRVPLHQTRHKRLGGNQRRAQSRTSVRHHHRYTETHPTHHPPFSTSYQHPISALWSTTCRSNLSHHKTAA